MQPADLRVDTPEPVVKETRFDGVVLIPPVPVTDNEIKRERMADAKDIQMKRIASNAADLAANARTCKAKEAALKTELTVRRDEHVEPLTRDNAISWQVKARCLFVS